MTNQSFFDASVELIDADDYGPNTWEVFANRKDSAGIISTWKIGTYYTEAEAIAHAFKINTS